MNLKMKKSRLSEFLEVHLQKRREAKANFRDNPRLYGKFLNSLTHEARWYQQHLMYQLSGSMNSRDMLRVDPHAHGVANGD